MLSAGRVSAGRVSAGRVSTGRDSTGRDSTGRDSTGRDSITVVSAGLFSTGFVSVFVEATSVKLPGFTISADSIGLSTGTFTDPVIEASSAGLIIVCAKSDATCV
jgi:hypothetical protein